jgi:putative transcriptional regulator
MAADELSLSPVLLLAMPQMTDPNFHKSVVLVTEYGPDGAFGLVLNRPMEVPAISVVRAEPPLSVDPSVHLFVGGPCEQTRAWVLMRDRTRDAEAHEVLPGLCLSASPELVREGLTHPGGGGLRILVGYAGWAAGQLDVELAESAWLMAPVDPALVFDTPVTQMWESALHRLGTSPALLQEGGGVQ